MTYSTPQATSVACSDLSFEWPDGTIVLNGLSFATGWGRTGLVGSNGTGKSTLLRVLAGRLHPTRGSVSVTGRLGYLPQDGSLDTAMRVEQALGITERRAALHAIEAGDASEAHFEALGDDWDIEERALATLGSLGLDDVTLDRPLGQLSGGETVLLRLAALLLQRPDVLLLDEPTTNLDLFARKRLYDTVDSWRSGALLVVSHDRDLLERVDRIAELRSGAVTFYGGGWSAYEKALATQQEAAERALRTADADVRRQERELDEARNRTARRQRRGAKAQTEKRVPGIVAGERKRAAQESAGKLQGVQQDELRKARERREEAADAVRDDTEIRVDLPNTAVPTGRTIARLHGFRPAFGALREGALDVRGPERVALVGRNGAGKTTLLRTLAGELAPLAGEVAVPVPHRLLPQRPTVLDPQQSVAANVARLAPEATDRHIRAQLARFLFKGARAQQPAGSLSGGERFRATLAALLLATPAPQLLMLDEPTNSLDVTSARQLTSTLAAYRGALLVASHDLAFLDSLGITRWLFVDDRLHETTAEEVRGLLTDAR